MTLTGILAKFNLKSQLQKRKEKKQRNKEEFLPPPPPPDSRIKIPSNFPSELWVEICQFHLPFIYKRIFWTELTKGPDPNRSYVIDVDWERVRYLPRTSPPYVLLGGYLYTHRNYILLPQDLSVELYNPDVVEISKVLSLVSQDLYKAVGHLRFQNVYITNHYQIQQRLRFFRDSPKISSLVDRLTINLDLHNKYGATEKILTYGTCRIEAGFDHFVNLKVLELGQISANNLQVIPDLRGLVSPKTLLIRHYDWIELMSQMRRIAQEHIASSLPLPRLDQIIIDSYTCLLYPLLLGSQLVNRMERHLEMPIDGKLATFIIDLLGAQSTEDEEEGDARKDEQIKPESEEMEKDGQTSKGRSSGSQTLGKFIIRPGHPELVCSHIFRRFEEKLLREFSLALSVKDGLDSSVEWTDERIFRRRIRVREFLVMGRFQDWSTSEA